MRGVHDLPQNVELLLAPGVVAHPNRVAASEPFEVVEGVLGEVPLALNAEHDLHVLILAEAASGGAVDPFEKPPGLVGAGRDP